MRAGLRVTVFIDIVRDSLAPGVRSDDLKLRRVSVAVVEGKQVRGGAERGIWRW